MKATSRVWLLLLSLAGACGHAGRPNATGPTAELDIEDSGGRKLAVLPFPGTGLVHVSLWVDAGSRDASRSAVATLAAELAAAEAGDDVRAWVSPDGIELSTEGEKRELDTLFERLGRALAVRDVDPTQLSKRIAELDRRRHRALADTARVASELSMRALLGDASRGLFPLGHVADEPPRSDEVARFLASHFGGERTLSIVAGDVDREEARTAWMQANRAWPRARAERAARGALEGSFGVEVAVDREPRFAATALLPSIDAAVAARRILEADRSAGRPTTFAYPLRGGALLSVILEERSGGERAAMHSLIRAIESAHPAGDEASWHTSPREAAHQMGLRWSAQAAEVPSKIAVGIGAVVAGGRGDEVDARDPDRALRERAAERLEASLEWARRAARPELRRVEGAPGSSVLRNGARVRAVRTPSGSPLGLALAFEGGLTDEPPDVQGRAAIIAEALASRCGRELGASATVRSFVEEGAFGVSLEAPPERWAETTTRFFACMLGAELDARSVEDARVALAGRLEADPDAALYAAIARAVAPSSPSLVWPLGTRDSVERVRLDGVSTALARARVGRRSRAAVLGPVPAAASARLVASMLAPLPAGDPARGGSPGPVLRGPVALESPSPFLVSALRLPPGPASDARAYADAYADALRKRGFRAELSAGGGGRWGRWAAVRIAATGRDLSALARAAREIRPTAKRFEARARERARERRWARGRPGAFAALALPEPSNAPTDAGGRLPEPRGQVLLVGRDQPGLAYERLGDTP